MGDTGVGESSGFDLGRGGSGIDVLHVDDDPQLASLLADFLEDEYETFTVHTATRAREGQELLETEPIDCVVSDYEMPGMDGLEFLSVVRETAAELPFIMFVGDGSEQVASRAISRGVTEYMQKGTGTEQYRVLGNRIQNAVAQYRAQQALYESEERYRTVVENSHEGVYIYSGDEFRFANERIAELTGYDLEELADIDIFSLLHPEDRDRVTEIARKRASPEEDAPSTYEARVIRKDGEVRHCEFAVERLTYEGEFAALGSVRDITQRRERERRLERFETMVQVSGDPMYTLDEDGRFTFVNDRLCAISGYTDEELLGAHVSMLMEEDDVETGDTVITDLLDGNETTQATFEMDVYTAHGERIECENHIALLPFEDGEFSGTVGVVRDISDRKRRERRLTALHEAANDLERATTAEAVYASLVEAAEEILDFDFVSVDVIEGDTLVMKESSGFEQDGYYEEVDLEAEDNLGARAARSGETILENDLRTLDVTPADPEYKSALTVPIGEMGIFQAGSKSADAFGAIDRELSELLVEHARTALVNIQNEHRLREQRRKLQRENERLEEFASVVSHDLRNPLTVATGRLAEAKAEHESPALDEVETALTRMDDLINDLLTLARQGQAVESVEPVPLPELLQTCWGNVATEEAELVIETAETVLADRSRLAQVFENLFRNSVEHGLQEPGVGEGATNGGSAIEIRVGSLPDGFFVEDTGTGIPEDERDHVFETGYSTSQDGTGFGLRIVEQVADAHGWSVAIAESDAGGARFEFTAVEAA